MRVDTAPLRNLWEENQGLKGQVNALRGELERLRHTIHGLNGLHISIDEITPETDIGSLLHDILQAGLEAVNSDDGSIQLIDTQNNELVFVKVLGQAKEKLTGFRMPANEGIAGWVVSNQSPTMVTNVHKDPRWSSRIDQAINFRTTSLISVPLMENDRVLGAIEVVNRHHNQTFTIEDLDVLLLVGHLASMALTKADKSQTS